MNKNFFKRIISFFIAFCVVLHFYADFAVISNAESDKQKFTTEKEGISSLNFNSPADMISQMEKVDENKDYIFWFDPKSMFFGLQNKVNNEFISSNPYNADSSRFCSGNIENNIYSHIVVNYTNKNNVPDTLWSYTDCYKLGQYNVYMDKNKSVITELSIGKESDSRILPEVMSEDSFKEFLKKIDDDLAKIKIEYLFKKYDISTLEESKRKEMLKKYPQLNKQALYILNENLTQTEKDRLEQYFKSAGYKMKDVEKEYNSVNYSPQKSITPNFKISVEYRLTDTGFEVNIPADKISFDHNNFHLLDIKVLEYFASQKYETGKEGFLLIPDGCGGVVNYADNTNEDSSAKIIGKLYGTDSSLSLPDGSDDKEIFYLPVYGISNCNYSVLAVIEDGSALSTLNFGVSGGKDNFYTAYPEFAYVASEEHTMEAKIQSAYSTKNTIIYDDNYYTGNYKILYILLNGNSSYYDMAKAYKEYLFEEEPKVKTEAGLAVETLGFIQYESSFLGFPFMENIGLTSFEDIKQITDYLKKSGVKNVDVFINSWRKGGFETRIANTFDPQKVIGGKDKMKELFERQDESVNYFANVDIPFIKSNDWFDGFSPNSHTVRLITKKLGGKLSPRPDTGLYDENTFEYALTPRKYRTVLERFIKKSSKYSVNNYMLQSFGNSLTADFKSGGKYNREQTLDTICEILQSVDSNNKLAFDGANSYVIPYASHISNVPFSSSAINSISYSVPFLQMVLNGEVEYSTETLNFETNFKAELLKCLATGTNPKIMLVRKNHEFIKQSKHTDLYAVDYQSWIDKCVEAYSFLNEAYSEIGSTEIADHHTFAEGVYSVEFANGIILYVNSTPKEYFTTDFRIKPYDFLIKK